MADYLPEYFDYAVEDPRLLDLRLRHLLTMTHGLAWKENESERSPLNRSEDWVADILSLPLSNEPGTLFHYSTGVSHLLSALSDRSNRHEHLRIRASVTCLNRCGIETPNSGASIQRATSPEAIA